MQAISDRHVPRIISSGLPSELRDAGLVVVVCMADELPENLKSQLINKSRQPHIMEHTGSNDSEKRFKDRATFDRWASKKRVIYALVKPKGSKDIAATADLAGISWFGERPQPMAPGYDVTFAIRLYEGFAGRRLSAPFLRLAHHDARRYYSGRGMWLEFAENNLAAGRTYEKLGYKEYTTADGRVIMVNDTIMREDKETYNSV